MSYPLYIERAKGSRMWDVDGNEYIDMTMGFGPHILGHAPDVVVDGVSEAVGRGLHRASQPLPRTSGAAGGGVASDAAGGRCEFWQGRAGNSNGTALGAGDRDDRGVRIGPSSGDRTPA